VALSYAWIPLAERSIEWVFVLVPSPRSVRSGSASRPSGVAFNRGVVRETLKQPRWAIALGALAVTLVIAGNVVGLAR